MTEEECKEIKKEHFWYVPDIQASYLTLVLCTKSGKQYKVAIKTLEGYPELTNLTSRYLPGKHTDSYDIGYTTNNTVLKYRIQLSLFKSSLEVPS